MAFDKFKNRLLFESLFNNAGVGIAIVNEEGNLVRVNAKLCALGDYAEEELQDKPFVGFTHPEGIEADLEAFTQLLSGSISSYETERRYIKKDGAAIWCLLTVSVARQKDGTVVLIAVLQNIDDRKITESALLESEKLLRQHNAYKDRLFSVIAHDLTSPVNSTASALELIEKNSESLSKEKIVSLLSKLKQNAFQTAELLNSLLSWSQSQFKNVKYYPETLLLAKEAKKVVSQLNQQAQNKNVSVVLQVHDDLEVKADKNMLHVILRNFLSNAIKFSRSGQTVEIDAIENSPFVSISVTDQGVGLSNENLEKLLNSNVDGISSFGTKGEKGTGLGINLCMAYIKRHGGSIQISSEVDKGSTFTFTVPNANDELQT